MILCLKAVGTNGVDILGRGIFETEGIAFKFPVEADTSYDSVKVGSDNAFVVGIGVGIFPFTNNADVTARNNLEIK